MMCDRLDTPAHHHIISYLVPPVMQYLTVLVVPVVTSAFECDLSKIKPLTDFRCRPNVLISVRRTSFLNSHGFRSIVLFCRRYIPLLDSFGRCPGHFFRLSPLFHHNCCDDRPRHFLSNLSIVGGVATALRTERSGVRIAGGARHFTVLQNVLTGCGAHPMCTGVLYGG
jgi:hypothetical protein